MKVYLYLILVGLVLAVTLDPNITTTTVTTTNEETSTTTAAPTTVTTTSPATTTSENQTTTLPIDLNETETTEDPNDILEELEGLWANQFFVLLIGAGVGGVLVLVVLLSAASIRKQCRDKGYCCGCACCKYTECSRSKPTSKGRKCRKCCCRRNYWTNKYEEQLDTQDNEFITVVRDTAAASANKPIDKYAGRSIEEF